MAADFERLVNASRNYHRAPAHNDVHVQIVRAILAELKVISAPMATAMMEVEWPEGMSAMAQMGAMHKAMIDSIKED